MASICPTKSLTEISGVAKMYLYLSDPLIQSILLSNKLLLIVYYVSFEKVNMGE
jgi:hypothetical protein